MFLVVFTFTEAHHHTGSQEEELTTLKEKLAQQKKEKMNLMMELDAKDSQLQLLQNKLRLQIH